MGALLDLVSQPVHSAKSAESAESHLCVPLTARSAHNAHAHAYRAVPPPDLSSADEEAIAEAIEERAAIREFEGGESSETAKCEARVAMCAFRYRLTDEPSTWITMIAPGCELEEARRTLDLRFGKRLLDVVRHQFRRWMA
jgi:hypothetical protein